MKVTVIYVASNGSSEIQWKVFADFISHSYCQNLNHSQMVYWLLPAWTKRFEKPHELLVTIGSSSHFIHITAKLVKAWSVALVLCILLQLSGLNWHCGTCQLIYNFDSWHFYADRVLVLPPLSKGLHQTCQTQGFKQFKSEVSKPWPAGQTWPASWLYLARENI